MGSRKSNTCHSPLYTCTCTHTQSTLWRVARRWPRIPTPGTLLQTSSSWSRPGNCEVICCSAGPLVCHVTSPVWHVTLQWCGVLLLRHSLRLHHWRPADHSGYVSVQCAVCNVQCVVCMVQCAGCSVQCVVCSVQCAGCSVQCVVCSV